MGIENYNRWRYRKINGWRYYERNRRYPPSSPPYPNEVVGRTITAFSKFEEESTSLWSEKNSIKDAEQLRDNMKPNVLNHLKALSGFRTEGGNYKDAEIKANSVFFNTMKDIYENNPDDFILLVMAGEREALVNGLSRSFTVQNWMSYYRDPEKIYELPMSTQNIIFSGMKFLVWESAAPSYDSLGKYPNPFGHEYEMYISGIYDHAFTTDEDGNESYEIKIKMNPQTGIDFTTFSFPVSEIS